MTSVTLSKGPEGRLLPSQPLPTNLEQVKAYAAAKKAADKANTILDHAESFVASASLSDNSSSDLNPDKGYVALSQSFDTNGNGDDLEMVCSLAAGEKDKPLSYEHELDGWIYQTYNTTTYDDDGDEVEGFHREYTEKLSHHGRDKLDLDYKLSTDWSDDDHIVTSQYTLKENAPGIVTFSFDEPEDIFGLLAPTPQIV